MARNRGKTNGAEELPPLIDIEAPAGFDTIDDSFGDDWEPEIGGQLIGTVTGRIREFIANKGQRDEHVWRACNIIEDDTGVVYTIRESASLRAWFDKIDEGARVYLAYRGEQPTGKASPMKVFQAGIASAQAPRSVGSGQGGRVLRR